MYGQDEYNMDGNVDPSKMGPYKRAVPPAKQVYHSNSLFEDTANMPSAAYPQQQQYGMYAPAGEPGQNSFQGGQQGFMVPGQQLMNDPMVANMAMQYGSNLADQGKDFVNKNLDKWMSVSKVKHYFTVDTAYVYKKLGMLVFPFARMDWSVNMTSEQGRAPPRYELHAPDLYIPCMAIVTYILMGGYVLGLQNRFNPELLGIQASSVMAWVLLEVALLLLFFYIANVQTEVTTLDLLSFCCYKFVGMVASLIGGIFGSVVGYYLVFAWFGVALAYFLVRTLRVALLAGCNQGHEGHRRKLYLVLTIAFIQPILMYWGTVRLMFA